MKKKITLSLVSGLCIALAGCGAKDEVGGGIDSSKESSVVVVDDSSEHTEAPTEAPTEEPTPEPTVEVTEEPTEAPTSEPTEAPSVEPTNVPEIAPTPVAKEEATPVPTEAPTPEPNYDAPEYWYVIETTTYDTDTEHVVEYLYRNIATLATKTEVSRTAHVWTTGERTEILNIDGSITYCKHIICANCGYDSGRAEPCD